MDKLAARQIAAAANDTPTLDQMSEQEIAKLTPEKRIELLAERQEWSTKRAYNTQLMMQSQGQLPFQLAWGSRGIADIVNS